MLLTLPVFLQTNAQRLALLVEMTTFQAKRFRSVRNVMGLSFKLGKY